MVQGVVIENGCLLDTNPATGQVIAQVPVTTIPELEMVMQQAAKAASASSPWAQASVQERIAAIRQGLQELANKQDYLAELIVQEMGKPLQQAQDEMQGAVAKEAYLQLLQETVQPQQVSSNCTILRQPLGVVLVLSPWNFPVDEILLLALPALASGNAVVVKPSEVTPLCGKEVVQALQKHLAKYDANLIQCIQGDGPSIGASAVSHPLVNLIAMTGSSATGKRVLQSSVADHDTTTTSNNTVKRVILEMGGKDPMLVLDDANIQLAARDAVEFSLQNTGQVCCSLERIYVHESIFPQFSDQVVEQAKLYPIGNGMDASVKIGPMVSQLQKRHVQNQVQDALDKGATLLYQGALPKNVDVNNDGTSHDADDGSNFYPVTVLSNVQDGMSIYRDETFGPVVCLIPFKGKDTSTSSGSGSSTDADDAEAVRLANDTNYGLAAAVYSSNPERARRVASQIQAGAIGINTYSLAGHMHVSCPWVGHKESGFGCHSGKEGFLQFSQSKSLIALPLDAQDAEE
jgi:succinate-semialdehyde dehydrogenase / glutarate-semialdehyde dehydrogenase